MEQVTDIIDGRRVFGPPDDIREVRNAKRAYDLLGNWDPRNMDDLLEAHGVMMEGLRKDAGTFRTKNAGVYDGDRLIHAGTPASYVPEVMADLFEWLGSTKLHPLLAYAYSITSSNSSTRSPTETAASEGSGTRCCWLDGAPCSPGCRSKA